MNSDLKAQEITSLWESCMQEVMTPNGHTRTSSAIHLFAEKLRQEDAARIAMLVDALKTNKHYSECYKDKFPDSGANFALEDAEMVLSATSAKVTEYREAERKRIRNEVIDEIGNELDYNGSMSDLISQLTRMKEE